MKSLKRALAAITIFAVIAAISAFPSLAAGFRYEAEAKILNDLKLMEGMGLGDQVNRIQGLIFAIKAAGLKDEVDAMSDTEVASILKNVTDADQIPPYGRKWAAYAVKNDFTTGIDASILPKVKFAPLQEVSGTSFLVWVLKIGMGYTDVGTGNAVTDAVKCGVISEAQVRELGGKAALTRDDAAGILYGACKNGINADGRPFVQYLMDAGFLTEEQVAAAGVKIPEMPKEVGIEKAEAVAPDRIAITVKGNFAGFVTDDLLITTLSDIADSQGNLRTDLKALKIAKVEASLNSSRNTVVTLMLGEKLSNDLDPRVYVYVVGNESVNTYGQTLKKDYEKAYPVADRIAPKLRDDGDNGTPTDIEKQNGWFSDYLYADSLENYLVLHFSEELQPLSEADLAQAGSDLMLIAGGNRLVNGRDYEISSTFSNYATVRLISDDSIGFDGNMTIKTADRVKYLKDLNGNALEPFTIDFEAAFAGWFKTLMLPASDTIQITMTDRLSGWKGDINSFITVEIDGTKIDDIRFNVEDGKLYIHLPRVMKPGETAKIIYEPVYGERGLVDQKNVIEYGFTATIMR
ncbi:MAG: hypothetical protein GX384_05935 [Clostridiaceae bacterium]|jgi:hypothetical protein|nr:hypothetical protein [Bacillota bacterium]NLI38869.1 hypothetical protein [Clostridiaceae bacterium]